MALPRLQHTFAPRPAALGADNQHDMLGPWSSAGHDADAGFAEAVRVARAADQVVLALGETREMSGEAAARSTLDLPGRQEELLRAVRATGKPVAVVLFSGRDRPRERGRRRPGDPGGVVPGRAGRPCDPQQKYVSRHRDIPSCAPLFEFGHGPSHTTFEVSDLRLSASTVSRNGSLRASVTVANTGRRRGEEVVQLYLHDPVAGICQPVRRLRGFERLTLDPGRSRTVTFTLDRCDFGFYDNRGRLVVEPAGSTSTPATAPASP